MLQGNQGHSTVSYCEQQKALGKQEVVQHTNALSVETFKILLLPLRKNKFILCILLTFSLI